MESPQGVLKEPEREFDTAKLKAVIEEDSDWRLRFASTALRLFKNTGYCVFAWLKSVSFSMLITGSELTVGTRLYSNWARKLSGLVDFLPGMKWSSLIWSRVCVSVWVFFSCLHWTKSSSSESILSSHLSKVVSVCVLIHLIPSYSP